MYSAKTSIQYNYVLLSVSVASDKNVRISVLLVG